MARTQLAAVSALAIAVSGTVATAATAAAAPVTASAKRPAVHVVRPANVRQRTHAAPGGPAGIAFPATHAGPAGHVRPAGQARRARARVVVLDCRGHAQVRPRKFIITCADANDYLAGLTWSTWGPTTAFGRGVEWVNLCHPTCAGGKFVAHPVKVLFWRVRRVHGRRHLVRFTRLTVGRKIHIL